jgi:hypothetical protein
MSAASLIALSAPARTARAASAAPFDAEGFLALSRSVTGYQDLPVTTASRLFVAMQRADRDFAAKAGALAALVQGQPTPAALLEAAKAAGQQATMLAIVAAWYTGTAGSGENAEMVSYADALMFRPVADGITIATYCSNGPAWWTAAPPPVRVSPPVTKPAPAPAPTPALTPKQG